VPSMSKIARAQITDSLPLRFLDGVGYKGGKSDTPLGVPPTCVLNSPTSLNDLFDTTSTNNVFPMSAPG